MLRRETKLIQLEKVQFFIVLRAEKLTGKEMKDFSEAFLARIRSISELYIFPDSFSVGSFSYVSTIECH